MKIHTGRFDLTQVVPVLLLGVWLGFASFQANGQEPILEPLPPLENQSHLLQFVPSGSVDPLLSTHGQGSSSGPTSGIGQPGSYTVSETNPTLEPLYLVDRPLLALAEELVIEIDDFTRNFSPQVISVPEGRKILADAEKLRGRALTFRNAVRSGNFDHISKLNKMLRAETNDLVRRVGRVSHGRTGPNIERVGIIASTSYRINSMLR